MRRRSTVLAGLLVGGSTLAWVSGVSAAQDVPVIHNGDTVQGTIADGDSVVQTETLMERYTNAPTIGKAYRLETAVGGTYRVELRSCFFDAYLVVRDGAGRVLTEDDDGLIDTNSRVVVELSEAAEVSVEACALHGQRGDFELAVLLGGPAPIDTPTLRTLEIEEARRCLSTLESLLGPDNLAVVSRLSTLASLLHDQGAYAEARSLYERALTIAEQGDAEQPEVAAILNNFALLLHDEGDYSRARPLSERALVIMEVSRGPEHPDVATCLNTLAMVLQSEGDYAGARPLFGRSLAIREKVLGAEHPDVATSLSNLGVLLKDQGDFAAARPLLERALAMLKQSFGPAHPQVATSLINLGALLQEQGDYAAARPHFESALALMEKSYGPEHPLVATSLSNLGGLLQEQGELAAARPLLERALVSMEKSLGPNHPHVATSLINLATLLESQGEFSAARSLFERALAIGEAALGPEDPGVATCLNNLAVLLASQGDYAAARPLYERALGIREKRFGSAHVDVATSLAGLADLLRLQGDFANAQSLHERALAIWEKALGTEHPIVANSLNLLGLLHHAQGDYSGAESLYRRAIAIDEKALGPRHPKMAANLNNLAVLLHDQGDDDGARPLYERALAIWEEVLGPEHPYVADGLNNLALRLHDQGNDAAARPVYERVLAIREKALGLEHPDVMASLVNLAVINLDLGDVATAVDLLRRAAGSRSTRVAEFLSGSNESDAMRYVATVSTYVSLLQSSVIASHDSLLSYEAVLGWKGQVLRMVRNNRAASREELGKESRELADRLQQLSSALSRSASGIGIDGAFSDAASLEAVSNEYLKVQRELASRTAGMSTGWPSWTVLRDALPARTALVDLVVRGTYIPTRREGETVVESSHWTDSRVSAWITRQDSMGPIHVDLGPEAAIEGALHLALQAATAGRGARLSRSEPGPELRRLVWDPIEPLLAGIDTVIVSPDGVLASLPFGVLQEDDGSYLVEERAFVSLTDPTDLLRRSATASGAVLDLLAVGAVDYEHAEQDFASAPMAAELAEQALPRGGWMSDWPGLPGTASEARAVAAQHAAAHPQSHGMLLDRGAASEEKIKAVLPRCAIAHIATHGYFNPDGLPSLEEAARAEAERQRDTGGVVKSFTNVARRLEGYSPGLLSGLVCAGANNPPPPPHDDGYLTAEEVGWLDLSRCDLVVLSACDTGLGRPQSGEGLLGLRRAFLTAGARTVISSLWSVPDQETAEVMGLFYENLWQKKLGKHESLRAAQLEMIKRNRERYAGDARPATWGAFVVDGDWR